MDTQSSPQYFDSGLIQSGKVVVDQWAVRGWDKYQVKRDVRPRPGSTIDFFQYGTAGFTTGTLMEAIDYSKFITKPVDAFTRYAEERGVKVFSAPNVAEPGYTIYLKNVDKKVVRIEYGSKIHLLEPGESVSLSMTSLALDENARLPKIESLNNGFPGPR